MAACLGIGVWSTFSLNPLNAAPKEKVTSKKEAKSMSLEETISPLALDPIESPSGELSATPKVLVLQQGESFPDLNTVAGRNKLFTVKLPAGESGTVYSYVTETGEPTVPSSEQIGTHKIYVKISAQTNSEEIIVPIPVTVTHSKSTDARITNRLFNNQVVVAANRQVILLYSEEVEGKSSSEINNWVMKKADIEAWDMETADKITDGISVDSSKIVNTGTGAYTVTFTMEYKGAKANFTRSVVVFGAKLKKDYYTVEKGAVFSTGTDARDILTGYRTLNNTTASNATYTWVNQDGSSTTPENTYDSSKSGFHWGYLKMTQKTDESVYSIIPVPITVTNSSETQIFADKKAAFGYQSVSLFTSDLAGKTESQMTQILSEKLNLKAWNLTDGSTLNTQVTSSNISQTSRGFGIVMIEMVLKDNSKITSKIVIPIYPDKLFEGNDLSEWEEITYGAAFEKGVLTNPINDSYIGFRDVGIYTNGQSDAGLNYGQTFDTFSLSTVAGHDSEGLAFGLKNSPVYNAGYLFAGGKGSEIQSLRVDGKTNSKSISALKTDDFDFIRFYRSNDGKRLRGIGRSSEISSDVLIVYDFSLSRNLNFNMSEKIYNISEKTKAIDIVNIGRISNYTDSYHAYPLANGAGFTKAMNDSANGGKKGLFSLRFKNSQLNPINGTTGWNYAPNGDLNSFEKALQQSSPGIMDSHLDPNEYITSHKTNDYSYVYSSINNKIAPESYAEIGYEIFFGVELPYMTLTADPEEWNIYQDYDGEDFETEYTITNIPEDNSHGTVYVTFPDGSETTQPFTGSPDKAFRDYLKISRQTLPENLNDEQGTIKSYLTSMLAVNETDGKFNGLSSEDYAVAVNVYHLGAKAVAQTVQKDSEWTKSAEDLLTDPVILPGHKASYEYVDGKPDTSKVGLQKVKIRMTDSDQPEQTTIIEVPVNVVDGTVPTDGLTLLADDIELKKEQVAGLENEALEELILKQSKAVAWDNSNGSLEDIVISVSDLGGLTNDPEMGATYHVTLSATKESMAQSVTIKVTIGSGLEAEANPQTTELGTNQAYWDHIDPKTFVQNVKSGSETLTDFSVRVKTYPDTLRVTTKASMVVEVKDEKKGETVDVDVPVTVTWGNSFAIGGSGVDVQSPIGESTLALTLHDEEDGPYLTSTYGNLPEDKEKTALGTAVDGPFYQITYYDMSAQEAGLDHAKQVTDDLEDQPTVNAAGTNTPSEMVDALSKAIGEDGKISVQYGDVLKIYVKDGQNAFYYANSEPSEGSNRLSGKGPLQPLAGLPREETSFVVLTKDGFIPLYLNHLESQAAVYIPQDSTISTETYESYYTTVGSLFTLPEASDGQKYKNVVSAGFAKYPDLDMNIGEQSTGSVYVAESTLPNTAVDKQKFLKYQYDLTFIVKEPDLYIVSPLDDLSFGMPSLASYTQTIKRENTNWGFEVKDSRENKQSWSIMARIESQFSSGDDELRGAELILVDDDGKVISLNTGSQEIYQQSTPQVNNMISWSDAKKGFFLKVPPGKIKKDAAYTTRIDFDILETPNE